MARVGRHELCSCRPLNTRFAMVLHSRIDTRRRVVEDGRVRSLALVLLLLGACETQRRPAGGGVRSGCTPGHSVACACPNNRSGAQVCGEDQTFGACTCAREEDAGVEGDASVILADGAVDLPDNGFVSADGGFEVPDFGFPGMDSGPPPFDAGFPDSGFRDAEPRDLGIRDALGPSDSGFVDPFDGSLGFDAHPFGSACGACTSTQDCPPGFECLTNPLLGGQACMEPCSAALTCANPNDTCLLFFCSSCLF